MKVCFEYSKDGESAFRLRDLDLDFVPNKDDYIFIDDNKYKVTCR